MRRLASVLVFLLILVVLLYVVLPRVIEDQLAGRLQEQLGLPSEPEVEVTSNFPPELLLGRMDGVQVMAAQASLQGLTLSNAQIELTNVEVSVPSLLEGDPVIEAQGCTLTAELPAIAVDGDQECLGYLGLGGAG